MNRLRTLALVLGCFATSEWICTLGLCAKGDDEQSAVREEIKNFGTLAEVDEADPERPATVFLFKSEHADEVLKLIKRAHNVRRLVFFDWVTDVALQQLDGLDSVVSLEVGVNGGGKFTDAGLKSIARLTHLQTLLIQSDKVTDAGFEDLKRLSDLRQLSFYFNTKITGAGFEHLKAIPNLQHLKLMCCAKVDDASIQHLVGMPSLQELWLTCSRHVTDGAVEHLKKLSGLKKLVAPQLSAEAKLALHQILPACEIK